jgi:hypothetical protein
MRASSSVSGAHELADDRDVRVRPVRTERVEPLRVRVVVRVHPRLRRLRAHELEAERAETSAAGHLDRLELAARDPQRRVGPLARLRDHVAQREVEVLAVVLPTLLPEHRHEAAHRVLPHRALVSEATVEGVELGDAAALADAELDSAVAEEVERADPLGDARRRVGRELHDAMAEADVLRPLAGGGEEHLGRGRMAVLLEEVVLDLPRVVVAEGVRECDLIERIVEQPVLVVRCPRLGQLQLVEDAELHLIPRSSCRVVSVVSGWSRPKLAVMSRRGRCRVRPQARHDRAMIEETTR